jgi:hypothetical protein
MRSVTCLSPRAILNTLRNFQNFCLLFQDPREIQTSVYSDYNTMQDYIFAFGSVWVQNLVSDIKGET